MPLADLLRTYEWALAFARLGERAMDEYLVDGSQAGSTYGGGFFPVVSSIDQRM